MTAGYCGAMPGRAHADMMRSMSEGNSVNPAIGDRQPDLFDDPGRVEGEAAQPPGVAAAGPPVAALSDGEAKVIRARLEAALKPAAIARQLRISRAICVDRLRDSTPIGMGIH